MKTKELQITYKNPLSLIGSGFLRGVPQRIRTPGLLIRSQTLYPAELAAHFSNSSSIAQSA